MNKRRKVALVLAIVMSLVAVLSPFAALAKGKKAVYKTVSVKIGEIKTVSINGIDKSETISGISACLGDNYTGRCDIWELNNKKIKIHGIQEGTTKDKITTSNGTEIVLTVNIKNVANKTDKDGYNKLGTVQNVVKKGNFEYTTSYLTLKDYDKDGKMDTIYFTSLYIKNKSNSELKPDIRLGFYDKDKKLIGTYQMSKDPGTNVNRLLAPNETQNMFMCGVGNNSLDISKDKFAKIKYWKILKVK